MQENLSRIRIIVIEDENDDQSSAIYKHLDFECELRIGEEIKRTITILINYCNSHYLSKFNESDIFTTKWSRKNYKTKRNKTK